MVLHANFVCELKIRVEKKMNLLVLWVMKLISKKIGQELCAAGEAATGSHELAKR